MAHFVEGITHTTDRRTGAVDRIPLTDPLDWNARLNPTATLPKDREVWIVTDDAKSFLPLAREMLSPPRFWDETPEAALSRLEANWKPIGKPGDWAKGPWNENGGGLLASAAFSNGKREDER